MTQSYLSFYSVIFGWNSISAMTRHSIWIFCYLDSTIRIILYLTFHSRRGGGTLIFSIYIGLADFWVSKFLISIFLLVLGKYDF